MLKDVVEDKGAERKKEREIGGTCTDKAATKEKPELPRR